MNVDYFGFTRFMSASEFCRKLNTQFGLPPVLSAFHNPKIFSLVTELKEAVCHYIENEGFFALSSNIGGTTVDGLPEGRVACALVWKREFIKPSQQGKSLDMLYEMLDMFESERVFPKQRKFVKVWSGLMERAGAVIDEHNTGMHDEVFLAVGVLGLETELFMVPGFDDKSQTRRAKAQFVRKLLRRLPQADPLERAIFAAQRTEFSQA